MSALTARSGRLREVAARLRSGGRRVRRLADPLHLPESSSPQEHWQRIVLSAAIGSYIESLGPRNLRAGEISGSTHSNWPWKDYTSLMFPDFDVCAPVEKPERFDVVICEQVLEHVADPFAAARNLRELCVRGGHVIVSTPFLVRVHELPLYDLRDYWRFTPRGLRQLLEHGGFEVDLVDSWGNRDCVVGNFDRWPAYRWWHSRRNEPDLPVQVWAFARRPSRG